MLAFCSFDRPRALLQWACLYDQPTNPKSAFHLITTVIFHPQSIAAKIIDETKAAPTMPIKDHSLMGVFYLKISRAL
jgi:hypothetical protein